MLLDIAVGWRCFFLNGCQAQRIHEVFVNIQIKSIQLLYYFFFHFYPVEVSLNIRVLCNSAWEAHPAERVCWWQSACGLLFLPARLMGRGRSHKTRTLLLSTAPWLWFSTCCSYQVSLWRSQVRSRSCCRHCWSGMTPHWLLEQDLAQELSWPMPQQWGPTVLLRDALWAPSTRLGWIHSLSYSWHCVRTPGSWVCGNGHDVIPSSGLCCVQPGVSLLCHTFTEEDYAWGFQRNLKALDLSLAWLSIGFPGAFLIQKIPACHKLSAKLKGVTFEEILMQLLELFKRKPAAAWYCRISSPSLKEIQMLQIENLFEEDTGSAIHFSTSCRAALETRCHAIMRPWPELLAVQNCSQKDDWSQNYIKSCFNSTWHRVLLRTYINTWKWVWCNIKIGKLAWNSILE